MTTCVFTLADNQLTTVSGADAGTYMIVDNKADIVISGSTSSICPFQKPYFQGASDNQITVEI
jgi:hypothetical protein